VARNRSIGGRGKGVRAPSPTSSKQPAPAPKSVTRGRPPRLAHLLVGSDRDQRHDRAPATLLRGVATAEHVFSPQSIAAPDAPLAAGERPDILCLANPEWLPQLLTVTGPAEQVMAFRNAAAGAGSIPWRRDYERLEEDFIHRLLAPPPAERGISVHGARIVANDMRELIETLDVQAADEAGVKNCSLDLNALVPVPDDLLRLGPEDPAVVAWLWEHWGTTWPLRDVVDVPISRAELPLPEGHDAVRYRCWSADWTPWRALTAVQARWPDLVFRVKLLPVAE
jgi:hypothetical protein